MRRLKSRPCAARSYYSVADLQVFRVLGAAHIFVDQAVEYRFSADPRWVDIDHGGGMSVRFVGGDALGDALLRPGRVVVPLRTAAASEGERHSRDDAARRDPSVRLAGRRRDVLEVGVIVRDDRAVVLGHCGGQQGNHARSAVVTPGGHVVPPAGRSATAAAH